MLHAVADSTAAHDDREVVVLVGGSVLLDWLLGQLSSNDASRAAALRAAINLLSDSASLRWCTCAFLCLLGARTTN